MLKEPRLKSFTTYPEYKDSHIKNWKGYTYREDLEKEVLVDGTLFIHMYFEEK